MASQEWPGRLQGLENGQKAMTAENNVHQRHGRRTMTAARVAAQRWTPLEIRLIGSKVSLFRFSISEPGGHETQTISAKGQ